ncbi:DUF1657 domain-containing protein [Peribacillus simplex]|uniref:DUF1657 domain-containing protein n=2 Tax=Peribacillus TaxID=2675229 RepID=A0AA90PC02_9BACI|nr:MULTISPECIES: DUF1657 domain-containing protein [Peribacillus]MDP1419779.1 DUF1657 domain-containing protein [Peribacillus simplex]MDP1453019.1 DUF1657 domain-containing protein [Peribacillus frigoritolerans]
MTIGSEVKQCLASLKGVEASLSSLALRTQENESKQILHETMIAVNEIVTDLKKRVGELENEEFQYKGF